jgi:hypothetical protein
MENVSQCQSLPLVQHITTLLFYISSYGNSFVSRFSNIEEGTLQMRKTFLLFTHVI